MVKAVDEDYFNVSNHTDVAWPNINEFMEIPFELPPPLGVIPRPILRLESGRPPTDYFTAGSLKLVSSRLRDELEATQAEFEFFPVDLRDNRNNRYTACPYFFGHLLREIDCFDYGQSVYEFDKYNPEMVGRVYELRIHEAAIGQTPVFWIKDVVFTNWLVSNEFAQHLQSTGLTGMVFRELKDAIAE